MSDTFLLQGLSIYLLSLWKTYLGPLIAAGSGFSYAQMLAFNMGAALSSSIAVLFLTDIWMAKKRRKQIGFNKNLRKTVRLWNRFGRHGSLAMAPVLLGIPTYAALARRFKSSRRRILIEVCGITWLWCSVLYWLGVEGLLFAEVLF